MRILNGLLLLEAISHIIFYENMSYLRTNVEVLHKLLVFKIKFKKTDLKGNDVKKKREN